MDQHPEMPPKVLRWNIKKGMLFIGCRLLHQAENFEILSWHVKRRTRQLGERIFSGDISVHPYRYGQKKACDYCSFKAICGFDPSFEGFDWHRLRKMKKDEIWQMIRKEAGE